MWIIIGPLLVLAIGLFVRRLDSDEKKEADKAKD